MKKDIVSAPIFLEQKDEFAKQVGVLFQISWDTAKITTAQKKVNSPAIFRKGTFVTEMFTLSWVYPRSVPGLRVRSSENICWSSRGTKCKIGWTAKRFVNKTSVIWTGRRFYTCSRWWCSKKNNIYGISEAFNCVPNRGLIVIFDQIGIVDKSFRWLKRH